MPNPNNLFQSIKDFAAQSVIKSLLQSGISSNYIDNIVDMLTQSVTTSAFLKDVIDEVEDYVVTQAALSRYIKQVSSDTLHQYVAQYQYVVTEDIGLVFYKYAGNEIKDTRGFCKHRLNLHYHKNEVEQWVTNKGDEKANPIPHGPEWPGMIKGTNKSNIFIYRGGYNCRHQIIAVNTRYVPKDVLLRNIESGNWKPSQKQKEKLGL